MSDEKKEIPELYWEISLKRGTQTVLHFIANARDDVSWPSGFLTAPVKGPGYTIKSLSIKTDIRTA